MAVIFVGRASSMSLEFLGEFASCGLAELAPPMTWRQPVSRTHSVAGKRTRPRVPWLAPSPTTFAPCNLSPLGDCVASGSDRRGAGQNTRGRVCSPIPLHQNCSRRRESAVTFIVLKARRPVPPCGNGYDVQGQGRSEPHPFRWGSAPASGAVFRALVENIGRVEIFRYCESVTQARGWTRGASSHTRGGCAPPTSAFGLKSPPAFLSAGRHRPVPLNFGCVTA